MTRLVLVALAFAFAFNLAASQTVVVQTCSASACGSSCLNCTNSTTIAHNDTTTPLVLCPQNASQNASFCWVDNYWANNTWTLQNCSSCVNDSNTSCSGCTWVNSSLSEDFCADNGTCWSITYNPIINGTNGTNSTNGTNTTVGVNGTNITVTTNTTNNNGTNTTTTVVTSSDCNCTNATTGVTGNIGVDHNGNQCSCPLSVANTTTYPNGTIHTNISSPGMNGSFIVSSGAYLKMCLGGMGFLAASLLL